MSVEFKVGDHVRLKAGGPRYMLVQHVHDGGAIEVTWMDGNKRYTETFKAELLEHVPDDEDAPLDIPSYPDD